MEAGIQVACELRATLRWHVHRLEASNRRHCLRVPSAALFVVFVALLSFRLALVGSIAVPLDE